MKPNLPSTPTGIAARAAAMHQYACDHDRFGARAIYLQERHQEVESIGARIFAKRLMRAWEAEMLDPKPEGL